MISQSDFSSKMVTRKAFKKDEVIAQLKGTSQAAKAWTSVQVGKDLHMELNSEFVFMNHSCDPSVGIRTANLEIVALKDLKAGDEITFFYPRFLDAIHYFKHFIELMASVV